MLIARGLDFGQETTIRQELFVYVYVKTSLVS
jgi:hypothetical protein